MHYTEASILWEKVGTTIREYGRKAALIYKANWQLTTLIPLLTFKIKLVDVFQRFMKKVKTS